MRKLSPSTNLPARHPLGRWRALIVRVVIATTLAWLLANVPLPRFAPHIWVAYIQIPIIIFLLICYIGKLLIDTFFYAHH